jgi:hypothetical protein
MQRPIFFLLFVSAGSLLAQAPTEGSCPVFPADNIWNTPVDTLPVSPNSATWVNTIGPDALLHPDFASGYGLTIGIPFIQVKGNQTKYPATFQYQGESDPGPYAIPLTAPVEGGSNSTGDRHVISVDTQNCILYEIFGAYPVSSPASWTGGSGAIFNLLSDALRPNGWTSTDAAGLPVFAGLLRYDEILTGQIRHAIRFTAPQTQQAWVWPARHQASSLDSPQYPPMGARFRLRAGFDISGYSAINQIILQALKKYGIMLADNGSSWYLTGTADSRWNNSDLHFLTTISGSDFEAVDVSPLMTTVDSGKATRIAVSVAVSQAGGTAMINSTEQFSASVTGTSNQGVTWDVNGIAGGNSALGTISANGLYTAPAAVPSPGPTVTIHADSVAVAAAGSGVLIISSTQVGVLPSTPSLLPGATQKFTASVQDVPNARVTWFVNGVPGGNSTTGTIGPDGTYVAPVSATPYQTVQITAVYSSDASGSGSAIATII